MKFQQLPKRQNGKHKELQLPPIQKGILKSESLKAPLKLSFPAIVASRWMPGLFPEK